MAKHGTYTSCAICRGQGSVTLLPGIAVTCLDCKGRGRVDQCVGCAGQKKIWMGGADWLDPCPACDGTGYHRSRRTFVFAGGVLQAAREPVVSVRRNFAAEMR